MLNLLVIIPAHHQGSYKYEYPPEPDQIKLQATKYLRIPIQ